jgi:hypothetical protein
LNVTHAKLHRRHVIRDGCKRPACARLAMA